MTGPGLARTGLLFVVLVVLAACGSPATPPVAPRVAQDLAALVQAAFREEATGDQDRAAEIYLGVVEAASIDKGPWGLAAAAASLDVLVHRSLPGMSDVEARSALAFRTRLPVEARLEKTMRAATNVAVKGLVARSVLALAEHRGDEAAAAGARRARACADDVLLYPPRTWAVVTGAAGPSPLAAPGAALPARIPLYGPFARTGPAVRHAGRGCAIDLAGAAAVPGTRDVVVDAVVPAEGWILVAMRTTVPTVLRSGGKTILERSFDDGPEPAASFAWVRSSAGRLRLVASAGAGQEGGRLEINGWDRAGQPLTFVAPAPGKDEGAHATTTRASAIEVPAPKGEAERLTAALAFVALGQSRRAERLLAGATQADLSLVYVRALDGVTDLPAVVRWERSRAAVDRALDAWPAAWEPVALSARLAGTRRSGGAEARLEALRELDLRRGHVAPSGEVMIDAMDVATSHGADLADRARASLARVAKKLEGTAMLRDLDRSAIARGQDASRALECGAAPGRDHTRARCYTALVNAGARAEAARELARLRRLAGADRLFALVELKDALAHGEAKTVERLAPAILPGEWSLSLGNEVRRALGQAPFTRDAIAGSVSTERDAPAAILPLLAAGGEDLFATLDRTIEDALAEDRKQPPAAASTVVILHDERYDVEPSGLLHVVLVDLRRTGGTTDVESNAQAMGPDISGRNVLKALRRRIHKKDGRVVLPERTPNASQAHADLAQLEPGDVVEAIYEGYSLPGETGHLGIDTPDLLPDRTAVRLARVRLAFPEAAGGKVWAHPALGKAEETRANGRRALTWTLRDRGVRRLEDGVPKMDRSASVSFSTTEWEQLGAALTETLAALDDRDPEVRAFAAAIKARPDAVGAGRALVGAAVQQVGEAIKTSNPYLFSDLELGAPTGHQKLTARTSLGSREGSRSWLVLRVLRELEIPAELVVVESEPFSADPAFVPHLGRFAHPLVVARVKGAGGTDEEVWIDADVQGPPLPAGRVSPALKGRSALHADGKISLVPAAGAADEKDEVDIRVTVDRNGDAKGSLTLLLRGREAQEIAEALVRVVGIERERALRGVALAWVPFATIDSVQLSSSEGSWQVALRAEMTVGGYAQPEGRDPKTRAWILPGFDPLHVLLPRPFVSTLSATYAGRGARENALAVSHAVFYHGRRRTELPEGLRIARIPAPLDVNGMFTARRAVTVVGNLVEEDFVLAIPTGTVPRDRYDAFVADAHRTDDAFMGGIRLKLGP